MFLNSLLLCNSLILNYLNYSDTCYCQFLRPGGKYSGRTVETMAGIILLPVISRESGTLV